MTEYKTSERQLQFLAKLKPFWKIHCVRNISDEVVFKDGLCDAHTHGLIEYIGIELQITLDLEPAVTAAILNKVASLAILNSWNLHDNDRLKGLFPKDYEIEFFETTDYFGEPVLRLVLPDAKNNIGLDAEEPFNLQRENPYITGPEIEER